MAKTQRDADRAPTSPREWLALPELPMKGISDERETGSVYRVLKAGFCPARFADAREIELDVPEGDGMLPLPTITIDTPDGRVLYRLPTELNGWAYDQVSLAHSGTRLFPCDVEFGVLHGKPYAEFVVSPPEKLN